MMNQTNRVRMKIILVAGARPNLMKIAPICQEIQRNNAINSMNATFVHTGQHYDDNMSDLFFGDLELTTPDIDLGIGSGTHAEQTSKVMIQFEKVLLEEKPDLVVVVGDVNSTLACSLAACKLRIKVAHVEAGLRSFDRDMPEEINRILTDHISDYLFTTCEDANENLRKEGIPHEKIYFVGNVMIDTLLSNLSKIEKQRSKYEISKSQKEYAVLTLHRPENVDNRETFQKILEALNMIAKRIPVIFPVHPRTKKQIEKFKLEKYFKGNITTTDPLGYIDFLNLYSKARFVLTDSGGIQEETTYLGIPCITLRKNTERPITVEKGTNYLVGDNVDNMINIAKNILNGKSKKRSIPKYWDGKAAKRIVKILNTVIQ